MGATKISRWLGREVRLKRRALGLTQAQLSETSGVSERLIRTLEQGEAPGIRLDRLTSVLAALGMELSLSTGDRALEPDAHSSEYSALLESAVASWTKGADHAN